MHKWLHIHSLRHHATVYGMMHTAINLLFTVHYHVAQARQMTVKMSIRSLPFRRVSKTLAKSDYWHLYVCPSVYMQRKPGLQPEEFS